MLSILRSCLGKGNYSVEAGVELDLNLTQGVLIEFISIYQAALG